MCPSGSEGCVSMLVLKGCVFLCYACVGSSGCISMFFSEGCVCQCCVLRVMCPCWFLRGVLSVCVGSEVCMLNVGFEGCAPILSEGCCPCWF